jgi:hypothetical protein
MPQTELLPEFTSSEFDVFARKPVQNAILDTNVVVYNPISSVDQTDLEFLIPEDNDTYVDPDIKLYIRGKFTKADGGDLDASDHTAGTNNFLHSLFSQCTISLNGTNITQSGDLYYYRSYLETLLTYGTDASLSHLTNSYWYRDSGDMLPCDPTKAVEATTNTGFVDRWNRQKQSKVIEMYGRIHSDICNVPQFIIPGVRLQIKLTKAKQDIYLMNPTADSKTKFKFLSAKLFVRRIRANPRILLAHNATLNSNLAIYNMTRVELKTFSFSSGTQSLSIDNAVIGRIPKRLLFTMMSNKDFSGSVSSNPYRFQHFGLRNFAMYVNGKQIPSEGLSLDPGHEKTTVMGYKSLFEGSGIHHSNSGLQITHDMYINGYFMLLFDLTPDMAASEGHASPAENGNIRIECNFGKALTEAITCLLYLEYDNSVRIDKLRTVTTDF